MLATKDFRLVMTPQQKKQLEFLARQEGRSQGNLIKRLIAERYEQVAKPKPAADPQPEQSPTMQATG